MKDTQEKNALFQASHMMILITYTVLLFALAGETFLLGWEKWALIPILVALVFCWYVHLAQRFSDRHRLLLYVVCMMLSIFFYGIHLTSAFDLALVISVAILLVTTTGIRLLVTLCQITYFVTFAYDLAVMFSQAPETLDSLVISRILLHIMLVLVAGWLGRLVIARWHQVLDHSREEVDHLTEATGRLNTFLTSVSHEIRTPINAVQGLSGICLERTTDPEQAAQLRSIQAAGKRMTELISDILDYSDIDRGRIAVMRENYMLSSILHDLSMELKPYMRKGVELIIDVDPAIPSVMNTDISKLKKILWHLMNNALKFTREGGVYVRITSEPQDYGINLLLDVFDTGIGMTEDQLDRLYDGFYQADSSQARSNGGLGLGMPVVYGFVSALGGFIHVSSKPGEGTSVHVCLPQKVVDPASCMSVRNKDDLALGGFLHFEKYSNPVVRDYYNTMVRNIVRGLDVKMYRVDNLKNLKKLLETIRLTHLFVGPEEYESDVAYMEELARTVMVIVVADDSFRLPEGSMAHVMEKPFYCFPVAVVLNREPGEVVSEQYMYCRGVRALVVDDEPLNLTVAQDILRRYGIQVTTAASGQEAISLCSQENFGIVFMDHMMPGMDGIEAMHRIRSTGSGMWKTVPFVALTANAGSTARETFLKEGFDGFIPKPIDLAELERVLRNVLPKTAITYEDMPHLRATEGTGPAPAEAKPTAPSLPEDPYRPLRALGLDTSQGLRYCQYDDEFYRTLLIQFANEARIRRTELQDFYGSGDLENYTIRIHALKSTAGTIGAKALSEKARILEEASRAGRMDQVREGHDEAMAEYDALTAAIRTAFVSETATPETAVPEEAEPEEIITEAADGDLIMFEPEEEGSEC